MEGKFELQFEDNEYYLVDGNTNDTVATTDKVLLKEYDGYMKKLSLKNCEDVANGYDLVELFDEVDESIDYQEFDFSSFKLGFKKAIEILGDKKFSEFLDREKELGISDIKTIERIQWYYKTYFDKSQQTEWDVEICCYLGNGDKESDSFKDRIVTNTGIPKLDDNGCLILRRI